MNIEITKFTSTVDTSCGSIITHDEGIDTIIVRFDKNESKSYASKISEILYLLVKMVEGKK